VMSRLNAFVAGQAGSFVGRLANAL
jgi:hypothetical protein